MPIVKRDVFKCARCGHEWLPRGNETPTRCAKCKSPYWAKPRQDGKPTKFKANIVNYGQRKQEELDEQNISEIMAYLRIPPERRELFEQAEKTAIERYGNKLTAIQIHEIIDEIITLKRRQDHKLDKEIKKTT